MTIQDAKVGAKSAQHTCKKLETKKYHMKTYINEINCKYIQLNNYKIDNQTYFCHNRIQYSHSIEKIKIPLKGDMREGFPG